MLTPNLLLGELVGAQQGGNAEAAAAPAEAAGSTRQQRTKQLRPSVDWTLFVDFLSPACQSVLAVVEELQIEGRQLRVVEQRTVWCNDVKKCEYEKTTRSQCVPRLEHAASHLVLTELSVVVSTVVDVWGQGSFELGPVVSFAARAGVK